MKYEVKYFNIEKLWVMGNSYVTYTRDFIVEERELVLIAKTVDWII